MNAIVWVASWQMECCGEPFAIGDRVAWTAKRTVDDEWFDNALDPTRRRRITHAEEHHTDDHGDLVGISGVVLTIAQAWCRYGPRGTQTQIHHPIPGSATYIDVQDSCIPDRGNLPAKTFNGWIVELATE